MKRTATALRPSWYCTAITVASAAPPFRSRSMRTRSSNSRGKLERNIACSDPPNSTTVASFSRALPARSAVTCTGTRTALARGKKRANCSAQPSSPVVSATSSDRLTSPHSPSLPQAILRTKPPLRCDTHASANRHNVPRLEMHAARQRNGKEGSSEIKERERLRIFPWVLSDSRVSR